MNTIDPVPTGAAVAPPAERPRKRAVKILGLGGAGASVINALRRRGVADESCAALPAAAGGGARCADDPRMPAPAAAVLAEEQRTTLREFCADVEVVCLVAGLGGRTGTGLAPAIVQEVKDAGAAVLAWVTLPFDCEGNLRRARARAGLEQVAAAADGLLCLPNQKAFPLISERTRLADTFEVPTQLLTDGVLGLWRMLACPARFRVHLADLCALLRAQPDANVFATGAAVGANRSAEAVERLLGHPLLAGGDILCQSEAVLVSVAGGADLTMAEVHRVMEALQSRCEKAHVMLSAAMDEELADRLEVTLLASAAPAFPAPDAVRIRPAHAAPDGAEVSGDADWGRHLLPAATPPRAAARLVPPAPEMTPEEMRQLLARQEASGRRRRDLPRPRQTQLQLEIVSKGRFDKSEPTIHKGEDLDLPTYVRRGVVLN